MSIKVRATTKGKATPATKPVTKGAAKPAAKPVPVYTAGSEEDPQYGKMFCVIKDGKPYFRIGAGKARALAALADDLVAFAAEL